MGPWCKDARLKHIGRLFVRNLYDNIGGIMFRVMDALGYTAEQREEFTTGFRADLVNPTIHAYLPAYVSFPFLLPQILWLLYRWNTANIFWRLRWVVYGRKPHA